MTIEQRPRAQQQAARRPAQGMKILTAGVSASMVIGLVTVIGASVKAEELRSSRKAATEALAAAQQVAAQTVQPAVSTTAPATVPVVGGSAPVSVVPEIIAVNVPVPPPLAATPAASSGGSNAASSATTKSSG